MSGGIVDRIDWNKGDGLAPLIVQHAHDGRVLMLGYTDREALAATLASGQVHFHSRSRGRLWKKGETSGHVLQLVSLALDCDRDTLLCQAVPAGPTCHTGAASCFDGGGDAHPWLNRLEALIDTRRSADPQTSYVAGLFARGPKRQAQKVGEEGVETALAAVGGDRDELRAEAADLVFHLLVLLRGRDLTLADVVAELAARHPPR
ncbi:MAG TPA: bifunctional phosphoribosyl-AMP cyclohydrolase/phosphoribosyl-ATP diphosphatase HisIE [Dokdonella sp.]|uniref:bifunctional phosphoribosyl-AMP cyclohydrolase/phosphoribosyl-ATP diphosphatase HisIE n=1 Tax=Dokdonella sp. TaxID=2291710 RepID=UPI002C5EBCE3|nr:bifunctional phosphoribosyl-AMP cyclohydrolase/phosphoribosyl-ATP diphosphatase HisIE [Dokdonella sp.]HUD41312.1 bifunctional phosphoribosyl-AMP cyclohydrolase/phosphoribosyl-ATP diphosphatase HisIE [Dokdonella sp.]